MIPCNERLAKRQKRTVGCGSARVTLDVGGTAFTTSPDTLTSNSTYFASLFRRRSSDDDDYIDGTNNEIFIDQDPEPFRILLAYMRSGQIKVDDIDEGVLLLAEFLGIDQLLLAVKIRWYCNIGTGPIIGLTMDEDIAIAFDKEHGGIRNALLSGLFTYFLKQNDVNAEKDLATLSIFSPPDESEVGISICEIDQTNTPVVVPAGCLVGALTGLHAKGYTVLEELDKTDRYEKKWTFSRRRHSLLMNTDASDILIPSKHEEICTRKEQRYIKQFALLLEEMEAFVGCVKRT